MFKKIFSFRGLVLLLVLVASAGIFYKYKVLDVPLIPDQSGEIWLVEARISYQADGDPAKVMLSLPGDGETDPLPGQQISLGYGFSKEVEDDREVGVWSARNPEGNQLLYYRTRVDESQLQFEFSKYKDEAVPQIPEADINLDNTTGGSRSMALGVIHQRALQRSDDDHTYVKRVQELTAEESDDEALILLKRYYEKKYANDWQRALTMALLKQAQIPCKRCIGSRLVEDHYSKEPVRLIEYYDRSGKTWHIIRPTGKSLDNIFVWARTSNLLEVMGGENAEVSFTAIKERAPTDVAEKLENAPWWVSTISVLPASERVSFRYAALIPLGVLAVVILRNIIGLATLGTFMPVLLALAFLELPLGAALIMLSSMLFGGLVFRALLSKFHLLVVPRVAACVVIVTLFMMVVSVLSYKLGAVDGLRVTVFPMIVLAWTIERMSLIWDEEGAASALYQIFGSLIAALAAYGMMEIKLLHYWVEFYQEVLLLLLAIVLLIGRYTGYRLLELFRFKNAANNEL